LFNNVARYVGQFCTGDERETGEDRIEEGAWKPERYLTEHKAEASQTGGICPPQPRMVLEAEWAWMNILL